MIDFGGYRAMLLDFGVDPTVIGRMTLGEIDGMLRALEKRRGKAEVPSEKEMSERMQDFADFVRNDPNVSIG